MDIVPSSEGTLDKGEQVVAIEMDVTSPKRTEPEAHTSPPAEAVSSTQSVCIRGQWLCRLTQDQSLNSNWVQLHNEQYRQQQQGQGNKYSCDGTVEIYRFRNWAAARQVREDKWRGACCDSQPQVSMSVWRSPAQFGPLKAN